MKWELEVTVTATGTLIVEAETEHQARQLASDALPDVSFSGCGVSSEDTFDCPDFAQVAVDGCQPYEDDANEEADEKLG